MRRVLRVLEATPAQSGAWCSAPPHAVKHFPVPVTRWALWDVETVALCACSKGI